MPWDESLLEEEVSGFDPSLLEEEAPAQFSGATISAPKEPKRSALDWVKLGYLPGLWSELASKKNQDRLRSTTLGRKLLGPTEIEKQAIQEGVLAGSPGGDIGILNIPSTLLQFTSVPPPLAEPVRKLTQPALEALPPIVEGPAEAVREAALTMPLAPLGARLGKVALPVFGAEYSIGVPGAYEAFMQAARSGDVREASKIATAELLGGGLLALGTKGEYGRRQAPAREPAPAVKPAEPVSVVAPEPVQEPLPPKLTSEELARVTTPQEVTAPVVETAKPVETMTPAVMIKGEPVLGKVGETHNQIKERVKASDPEDAKGLFEAAVMADANKDHVFIDESGKILNREEAAAKFDRLMGNKPGTTKRLHSQELVNLPAPEMANIPLDTTLPVGKSEGMSETSKPVAKFGGYQYGKPMWEVPGTRPGWKSHVSEEAARARGFEPEPIPVESPKPTAPAAAQGGQEAPGQVPEAAPKPFIAKTEGAQTSFNTAKTGNDFKIETKDGSNVIGYKDGEIFSIEVKDQGKGTGTSLMLDALRLLASEGNQTVLMRVAGTAGGKTLVAKLQREGYISDPIQTKPSGTTVHQLLIDENGVKLSKPKPTGGERTREEKVQGQEVAQTQGVAETQAAAPVVEAPAQPLKMAEPTPAPVVQEPAAPGPRSPQALGIAPKGTGALSQLIDRLFSKPKGTAPAIKTNVNTPLPDFNEHATSKKIFSQPFGFERVPVLGAAFGGVRRLAGHVHESLATYWAERQIGRAVASSLGSEYKWLDDPFTIKDGQITNIEPTKAGQSLYISDVFEGLQKNPNAYRLNPEQQRAFDAIQALEKDFNRLEKQYDIGKVVDTEGAEGAMGDAKVYFPRIVTSRPEGVTSGLKRGQAVGGKAFFEKPRMFATEAEGWAKGYQYEPSIVSRIATRAERLYKRMADKRLAGDKDLGGLSRKELEAQLKESYAEELASGKMTEEKIGQIADSLEARGRVFQPAFFNKIFPEETANLLNKAFPNTSSGLRQFAASVNNALKGLKLGFDLGVGFIQGQGILARHPQIWAKAQLNSIKALFSPEVFPEYVRRNLESIRELAQLGSSVGHLEEYMAGLGKREILGRIPGVRGVSRAFGRQFQTFLDTSKVEMWKALRETTPREQWNDVVQSLESVLQSGRMEGVGISSRRALTERALLMAPAYYRGGLNLLAAVAEKGVAGQVARRALGAYAVGGTVLFYGVAKALGMSEEDIKNRMNPASADFMMWRVKHGNQNSEIGFGGFYRSLLRLMGNAAKTSIENPGSWASLDPKKNPFTRWYRSHSGPVVSLTWDQFSGRDFMGEDTDMRSIPRSIVPLGVEAAYPKEGQPKSTALDVASTAAGLAKYPSPTAAQDIARKAAKYMQDLGLRPKISIEFNNEPSYRTLRRAVQNDDKKTAQKIIISLQKTKPIGQIIKVMKAHSEDEFTDAKHEKEFLRSLSESDRDLYWKAREQRKQELERFFQMLP